MKSWSLSCVVLMLAGLGAVACDDSKISSHAGSDAGDASAGSDASTLSDASTAKDGGSDASTSANDAGDDGGPAAQTFHVPAGGGQFHFHTLSGATLTFDFPASAAGKNITVTPVDPSSISFASSIGSSFSDALELGPSGTTFSPPVKVTLATGSLIALNFHDPSKPADPLLLAANGSSLELTHFSTLAIVDPGNACQSTSGWSDQVDQGDAGTGACSGQGAATTYRSYGCKQYQFCYLIEASCCVVPGNTNVGCDTSDKILTLKYTRSGSNGGQYPYCDLGGGTGSTPYVQSISPNPLTANTAVTLTLTGTGFVYGGSVVINASTYINTTITSDTSVTANLPASAIPTAGTLSMVGFVPPIANATGTCNVQALANCDVPNRSNLIDVPIQ